MRVRYAVGVKRWLITVESGGVVMEFDAHELPLVERIIIGLLEITEDEQSIVFLNEVLSLVSVSHGETN